MFQGISDLNLDAKGRVSFPSRYRDTIQACCGGNLVTTIHIDRCLLIYPAPEWKIVQKKLMALPTIDEQAMELQRMTQGHATDCELDASYRILIPTELRKFAAITKHAILTGQGNRFELWDQEVWENMRERWVKRKNKSNEVTEALQNFSY